MKNGLKLEKKSNSGKTKTNINFRENEIENKSRGNFENWKNLSLESAHVRKMSKFSRKLLGKLELVGVFITKLLTKGKESNANG